MKYTPDKDIDIRHIEDGYVTVTIQDDKTGLNYWMNAGITSSGDIEFAWDDDLGYSFDQFNRIANRRRRDIDFEEYCKNVSLEKLYISGILKLKNGKYKFVEKGDIQCQ